MAILMMARPWKHPTTGVFYFRRAIPEDLRPFAKGGPKEPRREYKRSLHTKDPRKAKGLYADVAPICDGYFRELAARKSNAASLVAPLGERMETPVGLSYDALRSLAAGLGHEVLDSLQGNAPPSWAILSKRAIPPGPWGEYLEPWAHHRYAFALDRRAPVSTAARHEFVRGPAKAFLAARSMALTPTDWEQFCELGRDAIDRAYETLQQHYRGDKDAAPLLERFAVAPTNRPKVSIKGLIDVWAKGREKPREQTRDQYSRRLEQFSVHVGHDDARRVSSQDLRGWRDELLKEGRSAKTVNDDCVASVTTVFRAAVEEQVLPTYPFNDYKPLKANKAKERARRPYTEDEAAMVLAAARNEKGALRWLAWLMAYTGARPGEVAQLRKEDVRSARGITFAAVTGDSDVAGHDVKTAASIRDVPLHAAVIEEGFLNFVEGAKDGPLFGDLSPGRYGKRGVAASDKYMNWLRNVVGIKDKRVVGHSWRHRMEDELREIDAPAEVAHAITGRTQAGSRAGYGLGVSMRKKAEWIAKLPTIILE